MKQQAVIVDIDGTVANNDHRKHHVETPGQKKDWKAFFASMDKDEPKKMVLSAVRAFWVSNYRIIFVSGRSEEYRDVTRRWLDRVSNHSPSVTSALLLMRPDDDFRPDSIVKTEIYQREIEPHYNVSLVLDDRDSVVKAWRELGLECWQVAAGDF